MVRDVLYQRAKHKNRKVKVVRLVLFDDIKRGYKVKRALGISWGYFNKKRVFVSLEDEFISLDHNSELSEVHDGRDWDEEVVSLLVKRW